MMLLTLVENAINTVWRRAEGRAIPLRAALVDGDLSFASPTRGGFTQSSGGGTGLANIRARLCRRVRRAARFTLAHNAPRGVVATIALPLSSKRSESP